MGEALEILDSFSEFAEFNTIRSVAKDYGITPELVRKMSVTDVILTQRMSAREHAYNQALSQIKPTA